MWCLSESGITRSISSFLGLSTDLQISLFLISELSSTMYRYYRFILQSFVEGYFGCFHFPAIVNRTIMNWARISGAGCLVFRAYAKEGYSSVHGRFIANILRALYTDFQSGCTNLPSPQQQTRVLFCTQPPHHFLSVVMFILAILTRVRGNLKVVLIFIYPIAKGYEHFKTYFLANFYFFYWELCLNFSPIFFLLWVIESVKHKTITHQFGLFI